MRINSVSFFAATTIVATHMLSTFAAQLPTAPTSESLVHQILPKTIWYDSGLWRSEYLRQSHEEVDAAVIESENSSDAGDAIQNDPLTAVDASSGMTKPPAAIVYSASLISIPFDSPAATQSLEFQAIDEFDVQLDATMSEWDHAVSKAGGGVTSGAMASGPSVTSAIVGFVGIMIVVGAYVSSGKRNR